MKTIISILVFLVGLSGWAQYDFSGKVSSDFQEGKVYLSMIEDYRKLSGVYREQILNETVPDSLGSFHFTGDNLPSENKIYRIHIDTCSEAEQPLNHFSGHCANSKEILFVTHNQDTLDFPFNGNEEMFCKVISKNPKSEVFLKIDSLKNDMKFAFATYQSEANKKLNTEKWFHKLQEFGDSLQDPIAQLYIYAFISDRSNEFHSHYLEDLKANPYYDQLLSKLEEAYPNASYTQQYEAELNADKYLINRDHTPWWLYFIIAFALLSIMINFYLIGKWRQLQKSSKNKILLSPQEEKIRKLILEDKTNKEIAETLFVSVSTVKTHINNLYKKLNINSREELKNL